MTLTFRPYHDDDLDLLQACMMAWREQNPDGNYCHPGDIAHRLYNGNRGVMPLAEITRIYMIGNTVAALLLCYPRYAELDLFINPDLREQCERFLPVIEAGYQIVRDYLVNNDKAGDAVAIDCLHTDTALQALLTIAGFTEKTNHINLTRCKLDNLPAISLPEGFTIRSVTMNDTEQLANVHNKSFSSSWTADIYRDEVMLKPGYKPEREKVVVAPDGTFAAFTVTWLDEINKVGLFEPVGTHEDFRRIGLARALMLDAMHEMKALGMVEAEVGYVTRNPASEALYHGLGFETRYHLFTWEKSAVRNRIDDR